MLADLKLGPHFDGMIYLAESARNPPLLRPHHHVELEVNLVVRGSISYVVGGRRIIFERGVLLWLFPAQEHQLVDRSPDAQFFVSVFKPALIARSCRSEIYADLRRKNLGVDGVLQTRLAPESFDLIRRTMNSMLEGAPDPNLLNREAGYGEGSNYRYEHGDPDGLNAGLRHLLLLCWRCQRSGKAIESAVALHPAVRKALDLLSSGEEKPGLGSLARQCGASETHLSRLFARQIGVPLTRYRNSVRLGRFFDLYRGPEQKTITEAMFAAGFGSYAQFHRVFTQFNGSGPRDLLNRPVK